MGVTIHDCAVIGTTSVLLPGLVIGESSLVAAHSLVTKDVSPFAFVVRSNVLPEKLFSRKLLSTQLPMIFNARLPNVDPPNL